MTSRIFFKLSGTASAYRFGKEPALEGEVFEILWLQRDD